MSNLTMKLCRVCRARVNKWIDLSVTSKYTTSEIKRIVQVIKHGIKHLTLREISNEAFVDDLFLRLARTCLSIHSVSFAR